MAKGHKKVTSISQNEHLSESIGEIVGQDTIDRLKKELGRRGFNISSVFDAGARGLQKVRSLVRTYPVPAIAVLGVGMGLAVGAFSRSSRKGR